MMYGRRIRLLERGGRCESDKKGQRRRGGQRRGQRDGRRERWMRWGNIAEWKKRPGETERGGNSAGRVVALKREIDCNMDC